MGWYLPANAQIYKSPFRLSCSSTRPKNCDRRALPSDPSEPPPQCPGETPCLRRQTRTSPRSRRRPFENEERRYACFVFPIPCQEEQEAGKTKCEEREKRLGCFGASNLHYVSKPCTRTKSRQSYHRLCPLMRKTVNPSHIIVLPE